MRPPDAGPGPVRGKLSPATKSFVLFSTKLSSGTLGRFRFERHRNIDFGALVRRGGDGNIAANLAHSFAHSLQSVVAAAFRPGRVIAYAVIAQGRGATLGSSSQK